MNAYLIGAAFAILGVFSVVFFRLLKLAVLVIKIMIRIILKLCSCLGNGRSHDRYRGYRKNGKAKETPEEKGRRGENDLCRKLHEMDSDAIVLRNLYVPTIYGNTAEIDAVMLSRSGIYVFEYKNYNCDLYIPENVTDNWIRCTHGNTTTGYDVYSPVKQNAGHVRALAKVVGNISGMKGAEKLFRSYVVLGDRCNICTDITNCSGTRIVNLSDLFIPDRNMVCGIPMITLKVLYAVLEKYSNADADTKRQHVRNTAYIKSAAG